MVSTDLFNELVQFIFADFPIFDCEQIHIYAYSAFGRLFFWSEQYGYGNVNLTENLINCRGLARQKVRNMGRMSYLPLITGLAGFDLINDVTCKGLYKGLYKGAKKS